MYGTQSHEVEVNVPASKAWQLCRGAEIAILAGKHLSDVFDKVEIVEGNGGPGTVLKLTFKPGKAPGNITYFKEKFTVVDDEKRVKQTDVCEGGYLELGFNYFRVRLVVKEKSADCCVLNTTLEYDVKEECAANASLVSIQPFVKAMEFTVDYLLKHK
ncbi:norbelladine synthase-like isoform X4 [Diospyros lotus]|uniref:norbelladine synthase-like isoform X2 n=1 Tax=Diospyros lotus TaxID=55363 RepID=UPI00224FCCEE|nr:norbelladine synthase-like isoform X2 [Diospyros lotus]XP_052180315.1 norbelladine synthase-like isoform X4 [Diospyros lotus]